MSDFRDQARAAEHAIRDLFPSTPLQRNDHISALYDADILLKREDLSPVRSYKLRGAMNAMRKVLADTPEQTRFVCASAGNHAQGVAFVCRHFGVDGTIFMPVTTPAQKINKTRVFGGDRIRIELIGDYFDATLRAAQDYCAKSGAHFLSPFDDPDVIEGQSSVGVEIVDALGEPPEVLIMPVGGGGLSAGVIAYLNAIEAKTEVHLIEPEGGRSLRKALEAGAPVALDHVDNFVDGAAVACVGTAPFQVLRDTPLSRVHSVSEDRLCSTILEMLNIEGIVLEPAGALSVDALKDLRDVVRGRTCVCVTTGGNFDFERLPEVKERSQRFLGLKKYFILRLPQRPGALKDFLQMLGPDDDIARFEYLKKSARNFGSVLIGIETGTAENFDRLFGQMQQQGFSYRDITNDEILSQFLI